MLARLDSKRSKRSGTYSNESKTLRASRLLYPRTSKELSKEFFATFSTKVPTLKFSTSESTIDSNSDSFMEHKFFRRESRSGLFRFGSGFWFGSELFRIGSG